MSKRTEIKLKKHLTAHARKYYSLLIILYVGILSILIFPISFAENAMACFGGYFACPVICIFLTRTVWSAHKTMKQNFTALAESGKMEAVLEDFAKADRAMGKNLYIGKLGLYGKGSNRVVLYSEMDTIYSMISDRRGQNPRDLKFIDAQGKDWFICELDPIGQSNIEIEQLYRLVEKKNPSVKAGK